MAEYQAVVTCIDADDDWFGTKILSLDADDFVSATAKFSHLVDLTIQDHGKNVVIESVRIMECVHCGEALPSKDMAGEHS